MVFPECRLEWLAKKALERYQGTLERAFLL
jgi:hypothetical protein